MKYIRTHLIKQLVQSEGRVFKSIRIRLVLTQ